MGTAMVCVMLGAAVLSGYGISTQIKVRLHAQLVENADFTAHSLERTLSPLIDNHNFEQVQKLLETIGAYRFIQGIFLLDRNGRVVASSDLFAIDQQKDVPIVWDVFQKNLLKKRADIGSFISTAYPVRTSAYNAGSESDIAHVLYIVLKTDYQHQILSTLERAMRLLILVILTIITILGLLLIHFIIMRPLNRLIMNMDSIAGGEYQKPVTMRRKDELGVFMYHFNHMLEIITNKTADLTQSKERLDMALEASESGLWDWNIKTGDVLFNERWVSMLGYGMDDIEPNVSSWEKLLHPDDKAMIMASLERHMKGETPLYRTEQRLLCRDNTWLWILAIGKVVQWDSHGTPERIIGTHIDISRQKRTEAELEKHRNNLQQLVRERTKELEQTQKELLNKAVEAGRAQLSAMVLHNIGNAITPVMLNLEQLKKSSVKQIIDYLRQCYSDLAARKDDLTHYITVDPRGIQVAGYMGDLIRDLETERSKSADLIDRNTVATEYVSQVLSLQRSYAPGITEIKEHIRINMLVEDALKIQESVISRKDITLEKNLMPHIPGFSMEKNKLMQVLVNLIKNSCDAIDEHPEEKHHRISIATFMKENRVCLEISDTGCGVGQERQQEIFEFGISSKGSSGFGLYYCKSFVDANHGVLSLKSDGKGRGATVTLEFAE